MPGFKHPPDGHVSTTLIARKLREDRRVLVKLYEAGEIAGVRLGGVLWLERKSLAAYLWSRPRCVKDGCIKRVIGDGPGCHLHRLTGRHHTEETKRKMRGGPPVEKVCEWCGTPFVGRGSRFCGHAHATAWRNKHGPDAEDRQQRLQDGHSAYRAEVERLKAERGLIDVDELLKRLRKAGVPRSPAAVTGYVRDGLIEPERDLRFDKPQLFKCSAASELARQLRDYEDGRLTRFTPDTPERARFRGSWYQARHKSTAESGRLASAINRPGPKPQLALDEENEIRRLRASGRTQEQIADEVGVSRKQVRRVLAAQSHLSRT